MNSILKIFGVMLVLATSILFGAFVLMKFYTWCLVPLLGIYFNVALPVISFGMFVMIDTGLALIRPYKPDVETSKEKSWANAASIFLTKGFLLFICWITHLIVF